ncbi:QacE family quaternary ammonium compound efflux SMR transporter [Mycolicibacterium sp. GF69]|uniref:DMT family transporter n=1 Tax=Mycolicibacterium sp. GF69 TaxID=2267251 RepID=UPI000DCF0E00|nr:SMR family transporter [Mycolicibacterium sp. GF69]RAV12330.1 QacE family quaternary ammonium compound efflux SMR transporter [Mycolicibacterium sp. GF69]
MQYVFLVGAIIAEVIATLSLRVAAKGRTAFYAITGAGYLTAFALIAVALRQGMPLGIAYGIWAAAGVAATAIAAHYLFGEALTRRMLTGIAIIITGVLLVELGAAH